MGLLLAVLAPFAWVNGALLKIGRAIGIVAIAAMVIAILIQVVARYVFNNALPWPDEAARFCMLWMTGLMAPTAFRRGGFVALDMISGVLPRAVAALLSLFLLLISLAILLVALPIGWSEVTGFGGRFATASLYLPTFDGWFRIPRSWMMLSLLVGVVLLIMVNIELILRKLVEMMGGGDQLPDLDLGDMAAGSE
ncbi:TRAP transporter small permease subunit [Tateyamaria sp. ANG-S1]|uniref:TRAP transporter small permease n=1 Tax=Tateyamaria sp. ANG-S1 TaxID=1577905 RepID=UPI00057C684D|nr:TRAP transporter small permease subunit [Tateyamaria sp. ANG-S1]KIC46210.1 C4-dicarboxylate ABC transporter permease [Tateyamaria sp. ANG-S1]